MPDKPMASYIVRCGSICPSLILWRQAETTEVIKKKVFLFPYLFLFIDLFVYLYVPFLYSSYLFLYLFIY